ncbi:CHASE domain-containing protein [Granulosicoccus antarcticus]|uniref:Sensory/regulatory protein RpfC n=1 Tax=Granulosicoccus antarcticus IMCC3135 TaxID=1192854 RepID=A0A2Z2NYV9_9GAMM|nr:CHASE domain-containing protein [Granulosicoccus antarcticus]ASJ72324.1 Sensor histidine kinase RcsC [Granulosicoccus antarcticus IMCC3135]
MSEFSARKLFIPVGIFILLGTMTVVGWHFARETLESQSRGRFELETNYLQDQIQSRFDTYAQVLRGGVGLFYGSEYVNRREWYHYVNGLNLPKYFPGIQGVGFSEWIGSSRDLVSHEKRMVAQGFPDYSVTPAGNRDEYTAVVFLEPFDYRNKKAFGFDMYSEDTRRLAMERARDSGEAALSGKLELVQEISSNKQAGFLLYLPVYSTDETPTTVSKRRTNLSGFVYSAFRANDLMKGILLPGFSTISFQIYDKSSEFEKSILYDGEVQLQFDRQGVPPQFQASRILQIAGRPWHIKYSSTPLFTKTTDSVLPWVLLAAGFTLSLLLSIVAWMLLSARRRVEQRTVELRKQEDINSVLLENLAGGVAACDANHKGIIFNKKSREWFGVPSGTPDDLIEAGRTTLFEKDGVTQIQPGKSPLLRAAAGEIIRDEEICIISVGQPLRYVLATGGPLPDRDGRKSGAVISLRDITEHKYALENIKRQQNFLRDVIDNIPNLINARDRNGNYVLANKAYSEIVYGISPEELIANGSMEMLNGLSDDDSERRENLVVIDEGTELNSVRQKSAFNGEMHWFSIGKLPIGSNESSELIVLTVATDITQLKVSEDRVKTMNLELESRVLQRTTSLEEANQQLEIAKQLAENANLAKSSFLAAMSHEIRTPMNGVVGMVEVLMNESLDVELRKSLQMVLDSAFSLLGIIDDILDFSKIEAGHFELEKTEVNLTELVENVTRATVPLARKSHVTLTLYIDPEMPECVLTDITRIRQVMTNLIGNAIKFSGNQVDRQGQVKVRAAVKQSQPLILQLDVLDNGVGMSSDTVEHIFESFVQAESSITRRFGGSGLGLAICKRIVAIMEGEILVESELGRGSRFTVMLPLEALPDKESTGSDKALDGVSCILIDSDEYDTSDITVYLESDRASVHRVDDFLAAVETVATLGSPVVILHSAAHLKQSDIGSEWSLPADTGHVVLSSNESTLGIDMRRVSLIYGEHNNYISAVVVDYNALRRSTLIEAVAISIGRASPGILHAHAEASMTVEQVPLSVEEAMAAGSLILVVEDDSVNRMVVQRQLKLLGFTADFANNGKQALKMWRDRQYGLVLTDLHMPVMDGYSLTRAIRKEESKGSRIPIVALTANAMSGEPKRAADAGVDGYLTKPLQLYTLKDAVDRHLVCSEGVVIEQAEAIQFNTGEIKEFDPKVLPRLLGQDREIIVECLEEFLISLGKVGDELVNSIRQGDWVSVDQLAHRLKSSSLSVGALEVWSQCKAVESDRVDGVDMLAAGHADMLSQTIERTNAVITEYIAENLSDKPILKAS